MTRASGADRPGAFPRGALMLSGAAVVVALVGAAWVSPALRSDDDGHAGASLGVATEDAVEIRALRFADQDDGSVAVIDAETGNLARTLASNSNHFVRSTVRGLVRERKRRGIGPETAFVLARHADGRLVLGDPATGRAIELIAFGPDNWAAFARLLDTGGGQS